LKHQSVVSEEKMDLSLDLMKSYISGILKLQQRSHEIWEGILRRSLDPTLGIISATTIFCLWLITFVMICKVDLTSISLWTLSLIILVRTFLHTGLFIISHDAAHGTVFTPNRRINDLIGAIALSIYGLLPYKKFLINHGLHHKYPASHQDPDFHDGKHTNIIQWYLRFMGCYLDKRQNVILFFGMSILFHGIRLGFNVPALNLLLFWILPLLLSSMQLFYFGTFLPHRGQNYDGSKPIGNRHYAQSSNFSLIISFLTCYHFGYHWEHHEYPHLPWFRLPTARNPDRKLI
jgi:beta-carotene/zeaxanthin 4-ketolase